MTQVSQGSQAAAGDVLTDLQLGDHSGNPRSLSGLAAGDPLVVHFYRGWFCPKERTQLTRLVALQDELDVAYTRMVSISVEPPEVQAAFRAGLGARWTFLSDASRTYLDALALRETTDTLHDPYLPTMYTCFPDLTIHRAYAGYWFWGRATAEELRRDLREISSRIRSDWHGPAT